MSSRRSSVSSFDDLDFERISSPEAEEFQRDSPRQPREESPVLVDAREAVEENEHEIENRRLLALINTLQDRLSTQEDRLFEVHNENEQLKQQQKLAEEEKEDFRKLVNLLMNQLEEEKEKQVEVEREKYRMNEVIAENSQLKEAVEKLEKLSLHDKVKPEPAEPKVEQAVPTADPHLLELIANLNQAVGLRDQEIYRLKAETEERNAAKLLRKAEKEQRKLKRPFYEPYPNTHPWKTTKQLSDELHLADQQIGIIVEHNDYLRTIEANEHSQEMFRLRAENEQLNQTICFLKQQMI